MAGCTPTAIGCVFARRMQKAIDIIRVIGGRITGASAAARWRRFRP